MKQILLLIILGVLGSGEAVMAQKVNTDSLKLVSRISDAQLKLGKMQNEVGGKIKEKQESAAQAQQSADENQKAANELSGNPQDKRLARIASKKARNAKSDANKARKAAARLDDLNKNIGKQKEKVGKEQAALNRYIQPGSPAPVPAPPAMQTDSTRQQ